MSVCWSNLISSPPTPPKAGNPIALDATTQRGEFGGKWAVDGNSNPTYFGSLIKRNPIQILSNTLSVQWTKLCSKPLLMILSPQPLLLLPLTSFSV